MSYLAHLPHFPIMGRGTGYWLPLHNPKNSQRHLDKGITLMFDVCLQQEWCHPSQDPGRRSLALPQPVWVRWVLLMPAQDLAVETQCCSSHLWAGDHTALGARFGFLYPAWKHLESSSESQRGCVSLSWATFSLCARGMGYFHCTSRFGKAGKSDEKRQHYSWSWKLDCRVCLYKTATQRHLKFGRRILRR